MNKNEALIWIRNFLDLVDKQNNRATASPILFLLQTKQEYVAHPDFYRQTEAVFHHPEMEGFNKKSFEEAKAWLVEYGYEGEELEKEISNIEEFQMGHYWETQQAFFTEEGVKRHLDLNGHNLRNHRDYVVHCFRNPEMTELFKALRGVVE